MQNLLKRSPPKRPKNSLTGRIKKGQIIDLAFFVIFATHKPGEMKKVLTFLAAILCSTMMIAQNPKITEIKTNQLPKAVGDYVSKNLGNGTVTRAAKVEENGTLSYLAMVDMKGQKHAFLFDKDGKFTGKADHLLKQAKSSTQQVTTGQTKAAGTTQPAKK